MDDEFLDPIERELAAAERRPAHHDRLASAEVVTEQERTRQEIERQRASDRELGRWSWHPLECPFEAIERLPTSGLFEWERRAARRAALQVKWAYLSGSRADGETVYTELIAIIDNIPSLEAEMERGYAALGQRIERVARGEASAEDWIQLACEGVVVTPFAGVETPP